MAKIKVKTPVVEIDGDEMTRIIWQWIRERLILPYLDIDLEYYDLGVEKRDETDDQITVDSRQRDQEVRRRREVRDDHPGRGARRGIQPQEDVEVAQRHDPQHPGRRRLPRADRDPNVPRLIPGWTDPIVVGRHAFGDQYQRDRLPRPRPRQAAPGVRGRGRHKSSSRRCSTSRPPASRWAMYNLDDSIRDFARARMNYGLDRGWPVYLSTKNTILKAYDGRFKDLFAGSVRHRVQGQVQGSGHRLRAPPDRRHGRHRRSSGAASSSGPARTMTATSSRIRSRRASARSA